MFTIRTLARLQDRFGRACKSRGAVYNPRIFFESQKNVIGNILTKVDKRISLSQTPSAVSPHRHRHLSCSFSMPTTIARLNYYTSNKSLTTDQVIEYSNTEVADWLRVQDVTFSKETIEIVRRTTVLDGRLLLTRTESFLKFLPEDSAVTLKAYLRSLNAISDKEINERINASLSYLQQVIEYSSGEKGLKWQQEHLCRFIIKPLPLRTEAEPASVLRAKWHSFYFDDLYEQQPKLFESLTAIIEQYQRSAAEQDRNLLHLVQMSGAGKTHFTFSYARRVGGIVLRNVGEANAQLFQRAYEEVDQLLAEHRRTHNADNTTYDKERALLERAKRIMMLISLTAIELAQKFYAQVDGIYTDNEQKRSAYLRFISNGGRSLLTSMFERNVAQNSQLPQFTTFCQEMVKFAKTQGLGVIFLDEIHLLDTMLRGQFVHLTDNSEDIPKAMERLQAERTGLDTKALPHQDLSTRNTSLLYVLVLALETFVREHELIHVSSSTAYSAMKYFHESGSRGRLPVLNIIYENNDEMRLARFRGLMEETFGKEAAKSAIDEHLKEVKDLASRALYLWRFFLRAGDVKPSPEDNFSSYFGRVINKCIEEASHQAIAYLNKDKRSTVVNRVIAEVALGGEETELLPEQFETMVQNGIISLPSNTKELKVDSLKSDAKQVVKLATDVYLRQVIYDLPFDEVIKQGLVSSKLHQLGEDKGTNGELAAMALLRWHQGKTLKQLYQYPEPTPETPASLFSVVSHIPEEIGRLKFSNKIYPVRPQSNALQSLKFDGEFFMHAEEFKNYALFPSSAMGPDIVTFLLDDNGRPAAYLLLQSKNHNEVLGGDKFYTAVESCNYHNFYKGPDTKVKANKILWENLLPKITKLRWIRVMFASDFSGPVLSEVAAFNKQYPETPIILLSGSKLEVLNIKWKLLAESLQIGREETPKRFQAKPLNFDRLLLEPKEKEKEKKTRE